MSSPCSAVWCQKGCRLLGVNYYKFTLPSEQINIWASLDNILFDCNEIGQADSEKYIFKVFYKKKKFSKVIFEKHCNMNDLLDKVCIRDPNVPQGQVNHFPQVFGHVKVSKSTW